MKKVVSLFLALAFVVTSWGTTAFAAASVSAKVSSSPIYMNDQNVSTSGFTIGGNNCFRLRDIAELLSGTASQFNVTWNSAGNAIELLTGKPYEKPATSTYIGYSVNATYSAIPSSSNLLIDGNLVHLTAYVIGGSTYFKLRDLGALVPFDVQLGAGNRILISPQVIAPEIPENAYPAKTSYTIASNLVSSYYPRWQSPISSNLTRNEDGTVSIVEAGDGLTIETYDAHYQLLSNKKRTMELPMFGAFYSGEKYNYVAFGQENREENDTKEVIRIVRYDKSFNRIDSVSIQGGESYTIKPFEAGSGRMAEKGNILVFHTSRLRYTTDDGLNHQSQLTIMIDTSTMKATNYLGRFQENHVSHSFDQYVLFDGNTQVLLDHGDAYSRSIVLHKGDGISYQELDLFSIPGSIGANMTGVSIGGFEMSSTNYQVAMNTVDHSRVSEYTSFDMVGLGEDQRDILLVTVPKNSLTTSSVRQTTLAKYIDTDKYASIPKLVKINEDKLMVLWQEFDADQNRGDVKYVFVDREGQPTGSVQTIKNFDLSDSQPIVVENKVVWYAQDDGARTFYTIPLTV